MMTNQSTHSHSERERKLNEYWRVDIERDEMLHRRNSVLSLFLFFDIEII